MARPATTQAGRRRAPGVVGPLGDVRVSPASDPRGGAPAGRAAAAGGPAAAAAAAVVAGLDDLAPGVGRVHPVVPARAARGQRGRHARARAAPLARVVVGAPPAAPARPAFVAGAVAVARPSQHFTFFIEYTCVHVCTNRKTFSTTVAFPPERF